jgi:ADP-ribose pyrophosphatase YjhB (NUDIX family)
VEKKDKTMQSAALRELKEETGLKGEIVPHRIAKQSYTKQDEHVTIQYFVVRMTGFTKAKEQRTLKWVNEEKAVEKLSFKEARSAFRQALKIMRRFP